MFLGALLREGHWILPCQVSLMFIRVFSTAPVNHLNAKRYYNFPVCGAISHYHRYYYTIAVNVLNTQHRAGGVSPINLVTNNTYLVLAGTWDIVGAQKTGTNVVGVPNFFLPTRQAHTQKFGIPVPYTYDLPTMNELLEGLGVPITP